MPAIKMFHSRFSAALLLQIQTGLLTAASPGKLWMIVEILLNAASASILIHALHYSVRTPKVSGVIQVDTTARARINYL
jgi:hypothetical protein